MPLSILQTFLKKESGLKPSLCIWTRMLSAIAFYERASVHLQEIWDYVKAETRILLGPAPARLVLLADGRILPATVDLPASVQETAFYYDAETHRMSKIGHPPEGRFRRLPYVSLRVEHPTEGTVDLSDWIGGLRANPVPTLPLPQLLLLASLSLHRYIPISGATVHTTDDEGTDATTTLV
jgi:hypothetical protein